MIRRARSSIFFSNEDGKRKIETSHLKRPEKQVIPDAIAFVDSANKIMSTVCCIETEKKKLK